VSYNSSGIVTAMGGFTSDVGGPAVEISVSNGKIVFNVTGVGIAELTLIP
jgi:hypothetical protein